MPPFKDGRYLQVNRLSTNMPPPSVQADAPTFLVAMLNARWSAEGDAGLGAPHRLMYIQNRALDILCSDRTLPFFSGVCPTRIDLSIFESTPINRWTEKSPRNGGP